jgi:hypothetical protein
MRCNIQTIEKQAREGFWTQDAQGRQYLVVKFVEVIRTRRADDTQDGMPDNKYFQTSDGLRVIRIGVNRFKITTTGTELTLAP